jgi:nucleoside-diphosphate kinase
MPAEETLILIKPDAVERHLIGAIIKRIEDRGLSITRMQLTQASTGQIERHYAHLAASEHYARIIRWMTRGPLVALLVTGENAIQAMRQTIGATDPLQAAPGSIRGDFASWIGANLVHASSDRVAVEVEREIWFPAESGPDT